MVKFWRIVIAEALPTEVQEPEKAGLPVKEGRGLPLRPGQVSDSRGSVDRPSPSSTRRLRCEGCWQGLIRVCGCSDLFVLKIVHVSADAVIYSSEDLSCICLDDQVTQDNRGDSQGTHGCTRCGCDCWVPGNAREAEPKGDLPKQRRALSSEAERNSILCLPKQRGPAFHVFRSREDQHFMF